MLKVKHAFTSYALITAVIICLISQSFGQGKVAKEFIAKMKKQGLINMNPDPYGDPWWAGGARMPSLKELNEVKEYPVEKRSTFEAKSFLPSRVDNSTLKYFRPVFSQIGGSCGQASGIGYIFTYEINRLRDLDANFPENRYPPNYSYNYLNGGSFGNGSWPIDGWKIAQEMGIPNTVTYGADIGYYDFRWPQEKTVYDQAMDNRVLDFYKIYITDIEKLTQAKQYLLHHGTRSDVGGLINFNAFVGGWTIQKIAAGEPEEGKAIITSFGTSSGGHSMTIVGYDDEVRFDFNNDEQYTNNIDITGDGIVDLADNEIGAFIMVNSWGTGFQDDGFAYVPYRLCYIPTSQGGIWSQWFSVMSAQSYQEIEHTIALEMKYFPRDEMQVQLGYSTDMSATSPEVIQDIFALGYKGGDLHISGIDENPVEFSFDLTKLLVDVPRETDIRIFIKFYQANDNFANPNSEVIAASYTDASTGTSKDFNLNNVIIDGNTYTYYLDRTEGSGIINIPGLVTENAGPIGYYESMQWDVNVTVPGMRVVYVTSTSPYNSELIIVWLNNNAMVQAIDAGQTIPVYFHHVPSGPNLLKIEGISHNVSIGRIEVQ